MLELKQNQAITKESEYERIINMFLGTFKSKNTQRAYRKSINDFFIYLYGEDKDITLQDMIIDTVVGTAYAQKHLKELQEGLIKISTYNNRIKGIKMFYSWLIMQTIVNTKQIQMLQINPFASVKTLSETDRQGSDYLTKEEIQLMLDNPMGSTEHIKQRNRLILLLALTTGIRREAISELTVDNVKVIGEDICIVTLDKGHKRTIKPINNIAKELRAWYQKDIATRSAAEVNNIFNITSGYANQIIVAWAKSVGIKKKITFHSFRISVAIQMYNDTKDKYKVQKFLNHSNSTTTDVYLDKKNTIIHDGEKIVDNIINDTNITEVVKAKLNSMNKEEIITLITKNDDLLRILSTTL